MGKDSFFDTGAGLTARLLTARLVNAPLLNASLFNAPLFNAPLFNALLGDAVGGLLVRREDIQIISIGAGVVEDRHQFVRCCQALSTITVSRRDEGLGALQDSRPVYGTANYRIDGKQSGKLTALLTHAGGHRVNGEIDKPQHKRIMPET